MHTAFLGLTSPFVLHNHLSLYLGCGHSRKATVLKSYKLLAASGNTWVQQLRRACSGPGGIQKGNHIPVMSVTEDGKSNGNKAVMRQSQAYPRELGKAIVSAWLTTRVSQESSGYRVGLQGHAGRNSDGPEYDTAWEGREVASVGPVIPDKGSDFDSS